MTKTIPEITDEMYARAWKHAAANPHDLRGILFAALTPEPEIEVTEAMKKAGANVYRASRAAETAANYDWSERIAEDIHRAMVKAAPASGRVLAKGSDTVSHAVYAAKSATQGASGATPAKDGSNVEYRHHSRATDLRLTCCLHRRFTDPK